MHAAIGVSRVPDAMLGAHAVRVISGANPAAELKKATAAFQPVLVESNEVDRAQLSG
jgi:hypothetical protein